MLRAHLRRHAGGHSLCTELHVPAQYSNDVAKMFPRDRLAAVAEIFARGFLRLRALDLAPKPNAETSAAPLELSTETRLSGDSGLRDPKAPETSRADEVSLPLRRLSPQHPSRERA